MLVRGLAVLCIFSLLPGGLALPFKFSWAAEKIRLSTSIRGNPLYFMLPLAAEEKGFWKAEGVQVEWVSFRSGVDVVQGIMAGSIGMGIGPASARIIDISRGIPVSIVADLEGFQRWYLWVRADSPFKTATDLKGAKIGVARMGTLVHAYARVMAKGLGLPTKVRYAAVGGILEMVAALKSGVVDGIVLTDISMARLEHEGVARKLASLESFIPKEWDPLTLVATKELIGKNPEGAKAAIKGILVAADFVMENPRWSIEKTKAETGYSDPVAMAQYRLLSFSRTGKIYPDRLEKLRDFLVEYGLVPKDKAPLVSALYSAKFVPQE